VSPRRAVLTIGDAADYGKAIMRLVRLLIWLATLFFAVMLFLPLVREILRRVTESSGGSVP
jgi:preprotein translocase subunit SecG